MVRPTARAIPALAVSVFFLALAQPAFSAQNRSEAPTGAPQVDLLFQAKNMLSDVWRKIGCTIDPDGAQGTCASGQAVPHPQAIPTAGQVPAHSGFASAHQKIGCGIDPSGINRCAPNPFQPPAVRRQPG